MNRTLRINHSLTLGLALVVLVSCAYVRVWNADFIWDDDAYVSNNAALRNFSGLIDIWTKPGATPQYYPLVHSTFWLEYQLWSNNPRGYHLVNVVLHIATSVLLGRFLQKLKLGFAWPAAFIFALHPLQVESVAWITERKNVLSGLFYLLSAMSLLEWRFPDSVDEGQLSNGPQPRRIRWYWIGFGLFLMALLSKTTTCVLPAAFLVVIWWKTGHSSRRELFVLSPFFLVGIGFGLVTVWMEKWRVGAVGEEFSLTGLQRLLVATHALCFYVSKAVWPWKLTFVYPRWDFTVFQYSQLIAPAICLAVGLLAWSRIRKGHRGPFAIAAIYAGSLFPALGFFSVYPMRYSYVADHFAYLAMMPIAVGVAGFLCLQLARWSRFAGTLLRFRGKDSMPETHVVRDSNDRIWHFSSGLLTCVLYLPLTFAQTGMYQNLETLWRTTLQRNPGAWMAHHNLGVLLESKGDQPQALVHYMEAISLNPQHIFAMNNAGLIRVQNGEYSRAERLFRQAIETDPEFALARNNLGIALVRQGKLDEAISEFTAAVTIDPDYENAARNLLAVRNALSKSP